MKTGNKILTAFLFCAIFFSIISCTNDKLTKHEEIADRLRHKISKEIQKKFKVKEVGFGGGMHECVKLISLTFEYRKPISQDEARALIVPMLQLFLQRINENEEIRPYLQNYPFRIENIQLTIFIHDEKGNILHDPNIGVAASSLGQVSFLTYTNEEKFDYKNNYTETFEEAVQKLKDQEGKEKRG